MRTRIISGAVLLALVLLIAWVRGPLLVLGITIAAVIAVLEFCGMARAGGLRPVTPAAVLLTLALLAPAAGVALIPTLENLPGLNPGQLWLIEVDTNPALIDLFGLFALVVAVPLLLLWIARRDRDDEQRKTALVDMGVTLAGALYIGGILKYALLLNRPPGEGLWILLIILATSAADSGAYFAGRSFGKAKLIPHISPAKTWAGLWGGQIACILAVAVLAYFMAIPPLHILPLGLAIGLSSVAGDLGESLLKRGFGVKDSGHSIPGHGGLLDRLDSILFVLIVVYFYATTFYG